MGDPRLSILSLRTRTTATVLIVIILVLGTCFATIVRWQHASYLADSHAGLNALAEGLAAVAELPVIASDTTQLHHLATLMLANPRVDYVLVRDSRGTVLAWTAKPGVPEPDAHRPEEFIVGHALVRRKSSGELDVFGGLDTNAALANTGTAIADVEVGYARASLDAEVAQTRVVPRVVGLAGGVVIGMMIWLIVGGWTRRLDRVLAAADRLARGEMDLPLRDEGRDEIGTLAHAFERMRVAVCERDAELRRFNATLQEQVRERTRDLESALVRAEDAGRAKSDFLANMSHEIRTPMTAILGFAEMLADENTPPDQRAEAGQTIVRSGRHLLQVINDILDISKIESGRMAVESVPTRLAGIVEDVASCMRPIAADKGLMLEVRYETPIPRVIASDPTRIRQVLFNLVGNAIKFTNAGSVTISVAADAGFVNLRVRDTGIGIAPEQLHRLFRPFEQADTSMSRRFGGTGLGLAISRRLCELMGGRLEVESEPGKGSTFTAVIPARAIEGDQWVSGPLTATRTEESNRPLVSLAGVRILLCEDGIENQRLLLHILRRAGAEAHLAENGRVGLEMLARAREHGPPFDLVLLDMQMPEIDGYTAAASARRAGDRTPIVALTAHALPGDREKCLAAGCDDYLTKPVDRRLLLEICRRWADTARRHAA